MRTLIQTIFFLAALMCAGVASHAQTPLDPSNTCNLARMPEGAVRATHPPLPPVFQFPDPQAVPPDYSGCLNTWADGGIKMEEARFERGKIKWYRIGDNDVYCEYVDDRLVNQQVKEEFRKYQEKMMRESGKSAPAQLCPPANSLTPAKWR